MCQCRIGPEGRGRGWDRFPTFGLGQKKIESKKYLNFGLVLKYSLSIKSDEKIKLSHPPQMKKGIHKDIQSDGNG